MQYDSPVNGYAGLTALDYTLQRRSLTFLRFPGVFEEILQSLLNHSICSGPAEVKVKRSAAIDKSHVAFSQSAFCAVFTAFLADAFVIVRTCSGEQGTAHELVTVT